MNQILFKYILFSGLFGGQCGLGGRAGANLSAMSAMSPEKHKTSKQVWLQAMVGRG